VGILDLSPSPVDVSQNSYGQAYGGYYQPPPGAPSAPDAAAFVAGGTQVPGDVATSGTSGSDQAAQSGTIGMLNAMAQGGGPNPALAQQQQAMYAGQVGAQGAGGAGRGGNAAAAGQLAGMQGAGAMGSGVGAAGSNAALGQQMSSIQALNTAQQTQRAGDLQAAGTDQGLALAQAGLTQQQQQANAQMQMKLLTGTLGAVSGLSGAANAGYNQAVQQGQAGGGQYY
jgi:hypothetical protein